MESTTKQAKYSSLSNFALFLETCNSKSHSWGPEQNNKTQQFKFPQLRLISTNNHTKKHNVFQIHHFKDKTKFN